MLRIRPFRSSPFRGTITPVAFLFLSTFALPNFSNAQDPTIDLNKIYTDETHCLLALELRNDNDAPISCYCRDALVDLRYLYQAYFGKDQNLNGPILSLERNALDLCGENYPALDVRKTDWKWHGPEVTRVYPPDRIIEQIKPNEKGWRSVQYQVILTYRDQKGHVAKTEEYAAEDRFPPDYQKDRPAGAVCSK